MKSKFPSIWPCLVSVKARKAQNSVFTIFCHYKFLQRFAAQVLSRKVDNHNSYKNREEDHTILLKVFCNYGFLQHFKIRVPSGKVNSYGSGKDWKEDHST